MWEVINLVGGVFLDGRKTQQNWEKFTFVWSYAFDHKMKTNNDWRVIEPILESRKVGGQYETI